MKSSPIVIAYFSGTGNTKMAAELLAGHLKESGDTRFTRDMVLYPIEAIVKSDLFPEEIEKTGILILLYPVYAFDAPPIIYQFLRMMPHRAKSTEPPGRAAIITVPCDPHRVNSAAAGRVRKKLENRGYPCGFEDQVVMPSNFLISYPDSWNRALIESADWKTRGIAMDILADKERHFTPALSALAVRFLGKMEHLGDNLFGKDLRADGSCTLCRTCVISCPAGNIRIKKGRIRFGWHCILCMRCIYNCPAEAISPGLYRFILLDGGYDPRRFADAPFHPDDRGELPLRFQEYLKEAEARR